MLSPESIEKIQKLSVEQLKETTSEISKQVLHADLIAVPEGVTLKDLEKYQEYRNSMRGNFSTDSVAQFHMYCKAQTEQFPSYPVFINGPEMKAQAFVDYGSAVSPGHCKFTAGIALKRTALYTTLLNEIHEMNFTQRGLAEKLEEFAANVEVYLESDEGKKPVKLPRALASIRSMKSSHSVDISSEQNNYQSSASALEKQSINAGGDKPVAFTFKCKPYLDLKETAFVVRITPITKGNEIIFNLKVLMLEDLQEKMALEFNEILAKGFTETGIDTYIGCYQPAS